MQKQGKSINRGHALKQKYRKCVVIKKYTGQAK